MRRRGRPFVLWGSVWAHPRGGAKAALAFPLVRHVYRHADAVVTYGEHVRRYVARYRAHDDDIVIAPQSVEAELFGRPVAAEEIAAWRAETGLPDGPLVLYVGRLVEEKGIAELLAAWRELGSAATLVAIGDGPLAGEVAATPGTRLLGPLARERLPVAYAAADALLLPSIPTPRFREPWGLVCNEALHQGTPVVATTAVGAVAGGLVRDGETGLVVAPGDPAALASAIGRLLADSGLRDRLGAAGREALAGYTYAAMADAFGVALARAGDADATPRRRRARRGRVWSRPRTRAASASSRSPAAVQLLGDHVREVVLLAQPQDRREVPLAGDRVGLGDARHVGQLAAEVGQRRALGLDQDDRVRHGDRLSPGASTTTCELVCASTSALNACASVSIGGNVS